MDKFNSKRGIFSKFASIISTLASLNILIFTGLVLVLKSEWVIEKITTQTTFSNNDGGTEYYSGKDDDILWAKKIMEGGYILHFRHAERQKWIDVGMYDSLESNLEFIGRNNSDYAENKYYKDAVCLNDRGVIQSKAIGQVLKKIEFPIGYVISSTSCRSRETANLAFGGYQKIDMQLVHAGPYKETRKKRAYLLKNIYLELPVFPKTNTIVSSHNGVLIAEMFSQNKGIKNPSGLEEGGFYVISKDEDELVLEHKFENFVNFSRQFFSRDLETKK